MQRTFERALHLLFHLSRLTSCFDHIGQSLDASQYPAKLVDIGEVIPVTLYKAVAEVLAYVYRLKDQRYGKESRG